jgi:phosphate transport system substrate-binding protein
VGTTITWPSAPGALAETGSGGMVTGCGGTKGCIAYIGISYLAKTQAASLGEASVANKAGKFTQPTSAAVTAALASFPAAPASGAESLINTSAPAGYAIINYEYAIVKKTQPSAAEAKAVKAFLNWILTTGDSSKNLDTVGFLPLPSATLSTAQTLVNSISS